MNDNTSHQPEQNQNFTTPETSFNQKITESVKGWPCGISLIFILIVLKLISVISIT